jgi:hypothetical protein
MSDNLKPTPTEYDGVKYRSKSEAIFAFHLDKANWNFTYEGEEASEIHPWDFCLHGRFIPEHGYTREVKMIEYKPTCPTDTYIENLRNKIIKHFEPRIDDVFNKSHITINDFFQPYDKNKVSGLLFNLKTKFYIVYGSPWNDQSEHVYSTYAEIEIFPRLLKPDTTLYWGFTDEMTEKSLQYRFDLKQ